MRALLTSRQAFTMVGFKRNKRESALLETLRLDALPAAGTKCTVCRFKLGRKAEDTGLAQFRCEDCRLALFCRECVAKEHLSLPFDRIEV